MDKNAKSCKLKSKNKTNQTNWISKKMSYIEKELKDFRRPGKAMKTKRKWIDKTVWKYTDECRLQI